MALLPSLKRIQREDVPDSPKWVLRLLVPINNFFQNVYNVLTHNVTFQDNFRAEIMEITVDGNSPSTSFELPARIPQPIGVLLLSTDTPYSSGASISWQQVGNELQILNITGLDPLEQYTLRILVV